MKTYIRRTILQPTVLVHYGIEYNMEIFYVHSIKSNSNNKNHNKYKNKLYQLSSTIKSIVFLSRIKTNYKSIKGKGSALLIRLLLTIQLINLVMSILKLLKGCMD